MYLLVRFCVFLCSVPATVHHICWCVLPIQFKPLRWFRIRPQMNIERHTQISHSPLKRPQDGKREHNVIRGVVERHKVDDTKRTRHLVNCENLSWVVRVYIYNVRACVRCACGRRCKHYVVMVLVCVFVCIGPRWIAAWKLWRMQTNYFIKLEKQRKVFN